MTLPSRTRPELIRSLGERIAEIGRLPYLGALEYAGGAGIPGGDGAARPAGGQPAGSARQYNSAHRLRALWQSLAVPGPVSSAIAGLDGPVLLVDDQLETGWTMTVAARLLREAGAAGVLPLVLAVTAG
jgi:ATP-dependent DNA helicase RecQ